MYGSENDGVEWTGDISSEERSFGSPEKSLFYSFQLTRYKVPISVDGKYVVQCCNGENNCVSVLSSWENCEVTWPPDNDFHLQYSLKVRSCVLSRTTTWISINLFSPFPQKICVRTLSWHYFGLGHNYWPRLLKLALLLRSQTSDANIGPSKT